LIDPLYLDQLPVDGDENVFYNVPHWIDISFYYSTRQHLPPASFDFNPRTFVGPTLDGKLQLIPPLPCGKNGEIDYDAYDRKILADMSNIDDQNQPSTIMSILSLKSVLSPEASTYHSKPTINEKPVVTNSALGRQIKSLQKADTTKPSTSFGDRVQRKWQRRASLKSFSSGGSNIEEDSRQEDGSSSDTHSESLDRKLLQQLDGDENVLSRSLIGTSSAVAHQQLKTRPVAIRRQDGSGNSKHVRLETPELSWRSTKSAKLLSVGEQSITPGSQGASNTRRSSFRVNDTLPMNAAGRKKQSRYFVPWTPSKNVIVAGITRSGSSGK
jgi:hypothetical protein